MENLIKELKRCEINLKEHTLNGMPFRKITKNPLTHFRNNARYTVLQDKKVRDTIMNQLMEIRTQIQQEKTIFLKLNSQAEEKDTLWNLALIRFFIQRESCVNDLIERIKKVTESCSTIVVSSPPSTKIDKIKSEESLAKGLAEIGHLLGCGKTKSNSIIQSHILQNNNVLYYLGRTPILDIRKWELLKELRPNILSGITCRTT